jgi:hypothetical protein
VDAWRDTSQRTQETMSIPVDKWDRMNLKEQAELIQEALPAQ